MSFFFRRSRHNQEAAQPVARTYRQTLNDDDNDKVRHHTTPNSLLFFYIARQNRLKDIFFQIKWINFTVTQPPRSGSWFCRADQESYGTDVVVYADIADSAPNNHNCKTPLQAPVFHYHRTTLFPCSGFHQALYRHHRVLSKERRY